MFLLTSAYLVVGSQVYDVVLTVLPFGSIQGNNPIAENTR